MSTSLITCRELVRRAESGRTLLDAVSLEVRSGDRIAIRGPSGSGKSLLLRAMILLDDVDAGEVHRHGQTINNHDVPRYRAEVMYLPQQAILAEGTVLDNLKTPFEFGVHQGQTLDIERAKQRLEKLKRDASFLQQSVAQLSGGERQIVAVLRALALDPAVLLLDEPTAALDPKSTTEIEALLQAWHSEDPQRAYVWVTHDGEQAERVGTKQWAIHDGQLQVSGELTDPHG